MIPMTKELRDRAADMRTLIDNAITNLEADQIVRLLKQVETDVSRKIGEVDPQDDDELIESTTDWFISKHVFDPNANPSRIAKKVLRARTLGDMVSEFNNGGVRCVTVTERTKCTEAQANQIRRILGMDYEVECDEEDGAQA